MSRSVPQLVSVAAGAIGIVLFGFTLYYIDLKETVASARRLAARQGCSGCGMRATELLRPSLETTLLQTYVDAHVNHARMLRAYFDEPELAGELERRARDVDPVAAAVYGVAE